MDLNECFVEMIKDIYSAEKQLLKAMPKMAKMAANPKLKESIQKHLLETEEHCRRLEQVAEKGGFKPSGVVCKGMKGLIDECTEHMGELEAGPVADAVIIMLAQKNEHYEIGSYGSVIAWAKALGNSEAQEILIQTLAEEEKTDDLLSEIAETAVNAEAAKAPAEKPKTTAKTAKTSSTNGNSGSKAGIGKKVSVR